MKNNNNFIINANSLNVRLFHSSIKNYSSKFPEVINSKVGDINPIISDISKLNEKELEERINSLNDLSINEYEIFNELKNKVTTLSSVFDPTINRKIDSLSDENKSEYYKYTRELSTSMEESFPKLLTINSVDSSIKTDETYQNISESLSKIVNLKSEIIYELLKEKGIVEGIKSMKNIESSNISGVLNNSNVALETNNSTEFKKEILELVESLKIEIKEIKNNHITEDKIIQTMEQSANISTKFVSFILKNQNSLDLIVGAAGIISPVLAYRASLAAYSKHALAKLPKNSSKESYVRYLRQNELALRNFHRFSLPALAFYYLYLGKTYKLFTLSMDFGLVSNVASSSSLPFITSIINTNKNNSPKWKWLILFIISIICFIVGSLGSSIIKQFFPSLHLLSLNLGSSIITYPLLVWVNGWILFYILEFILFIYLSLDNKKIIIPSYLPQFIANWIKKIEENSIVENKRWFMLSYIRIICFYSILNIIFIYFFIV
jgi:hypothetical protein